MPAAGAVRFVGKQPAEGSIQLYFIHICRASERARERGREGGREGGRERKRAKERARESERARE